MCIRDRCPYPYYTIWLGSTTCTNIAIAFDFITVMTVVILLTVLFLCCLAQAGSRKYEALILMLFPTLDVYSDILYIFTSIFYNKSLIILSIVFFILPNFLFFGTLRKLKAVVPTNLIRFPGFKYVSPNLIWLGMKDGYPLFDGTRPSISFDQHDSIPKLLSYVVVWVVLIISQISYILAYLLLWPITSLLLVIIWSTVGMYLLQSKVLCIGNVWNFWFFFWLGSEQFNMLALERSGSNIDFGILNESLFTEFICETMPQLIIQSINTWYTGGVNAAFLFSVSLSGYNTINGLYKYLYYVAYLRKSISDVPQEIKMLGGFVKSNFKRDTTTKIVPVTCYEVEAWERLLFSQEHPIFEIIFRSGLKSATDLKAADPTLLSEILKKYKELKTDKEHNELKAMFDGFLDEKNSVIGATVEIYENLTGMIS